MTLQDMLAAMRGRSRNGPGRCAAWRGPSRHRSCPVGWPWSRRPAPGTQRHPVRGPGAPGRAGGRSPWASFGAGDGRASASTRTSGCPERHLVDAGPPFSGSDRSSLPGWMRFRDPGPAFDEEHLLALADAWPVPVLQRLREPFTTSTVSWAPRGRRRHRAHRADHPLGLRCARGCHRGRLAHAEACTWRPHGSLTVISGRRSPSSA